MGLTSFVPPMGNEKGPCMTDWERNTSLNHSTCLKTPLPWFWWWNCRCTSDSTGKSFPKGNISIHRSYWMEEWKWNFISFTIADKSVCYLLYAWYLKPRRFLLFLFHKLCHDLIQLAFNLANAFSIDFTLTHSVHTLGSLASIWLVLILICYKQNKKSLTYN